MPQKFYGSGFPAGSTANPTSPGFSAAGSVPYAGLAGGLNSFMTGQAQQPYIANLPNYQGMIGQQSNNITSQLQGEVPDDVIAQLLQRGAERGIITGVPPGSPNNNAAYMKSVYDTSVAQQATGAANLSQVRADTPVPELFNPASLFVPQTLARDEARYAREGVVEGRAAAGRERNTAGSPWMENSTRYSNPLGIWGGWNT